MIERLAVLIVGGYGTFGGRIVELLQSESRLTLMIAGRSIDRAGAFCRARIGGRAELIATAFDRDGDVDGRLADLRPDILVDASGPFQAYGEGRYRLVEACIRRSVNYLDLADGADFVAGIGVFDRAARTADRYVLCGASSFPVLTAAVVRRLSMDMARIETIRAGIAPSPFAGVGNNVVRAIAGYAGQGTPVIRDGKRATGYPFTEHIRFTIAPPGRLPLRRTLFSLVDVPDLLALAQVWPEAKTIWMGAGPVPELLHRALAGLAWLVRLGLIRTLLPLAPLMFFATNHLRWGERRGGMFVEVAGVDGAGTPIARCWHLLAEGDDGPLIPSMAVAILVRKALDGHLPPSGARPALRDLELDDYERMFAARAIHTGVREAGSRGQAPLYERILGSAWQELRAEIRVMHDVGATLSAEGRACVERGRSLPARLVAAVVGFPKASADAPVSVTFDVSDRSEIWTRKFGDDTAFSSRQFAGEGKSEGLLCESFGPLTFAMALVPDDRRLTLVLRRWSVFGVPLPMWLSPRAKAYETVERGRFRFHVEIGHPLIGLIVRYRGWLIPAGRQIPDEHSMEATARF